MSFQQSTNSLALTSTLGRLDLVSGSRLLLGLAAAAAMTAWFIRTRSGEQRLRAPERLKVICRTGLSQRCSLAVVELDGETLLVAFGDGFAQMKTVRARVSGAAQGVLR